MRCFIIFNFKNIFLPAETFSFILSVIKMSSVIRFSNQPFVTFWQLTLIWISAIISSLSPRRPSSSVKLKHPLSVPLVSHTSSLPTSLYHFWVVQIPTPLSRFSMDVKFYFSLVEFLWHISYYNIKIMAFNFMHFGSISKLSCLWFLVLYFLLGSLL